MQKRQRTPGNLRGDFTEETFTFSFERLVGVPQVDELGYSFGGSASIAQFPLFKYIV